jgi:hypothetical protein
MSNLKFTGKEIALCALQEGVKILLLSSELIPIVGSFARLLTLGIMVCENAKCNRDAFKQLKGRLCDLGSLFLSENGLTHVAIGRKQNSLLQKHTSQLEAIMEDGLTYLSAFSKVSDPIISIVHS